MEILHQPVKIKKILKEHDILNHFDHRDLTFELHRYTKGEQILSSSESARDLMFLVQGTVQIYSIDDNGELFPVGLRTPPAMMGEIEFITGQPSPYFAEAKTEVFFLTLSLARYAEQLHNDVRFLNYLLLYLAKEMTTRATMETEHRNLRERLLFYMKSQNSSHDISSVNGVVMQLHCSRRQLQRVLADLCEEGLIKKVGKGKYQLVLNQ